MEIKKQQPNLAPEIAIDQLKGTTQKLAKMVLEHGTYEFEGFNWLIGNFAIIADHLGVSEKTIQRLVKKPPFHYITRRTDEVGKHILLKLGTDPCETDFVNRLRAVWVRGLLYFNGAAAKEWPLRAMMNKQQGAPVGKLLERAKKAQEKLPELEKLKAGKQISLQVKPHEMGLLRECIKRLGEDASDTLACVALWNGWERFISFVKIAGRLEGRFYHWPTLSVIAANPDLALRVYLDIQQEEAKISVAESDRLLKKIASLTPSAET